MNKDPLSHLPHGIPFRFVDRVLELIPGERVVTLKNVTMNDSCMQGHFPGNPILPGVLLLEAMAQTSGLLLPEGSSALLAQVKDARFRRPVVPGDQVRIEAEPVAEFGGLQTAPYSAPALLFYGLHQWP